MTDYYIAYVITNKQVSKQQCDSMWSGEGETQKCLGRVFGIVKYLCKLIAGKGSFRAC